MVEHINQRKINNFFQTPSMAKGEYLFTSKSWHNLLESLNIEESEINNLHRLQKLLAGHDNLDSVPKALLKYPELSIFQSCQLLLHKKGAQNVTSFLDEFNIQHKRVIPVSVFNRIATTIRKSKHKRFDQSSLDLPGVDILGPFLAQVIQNERYDIIVIVSHNGFLPPSDVEEESFYKIIKNITPHLFHLTYIHELNDLMAIVTTIYKNMPMEMNVNQGKRDIIQTLRSTSNFKQYLPEKNLEYMIYTQQASDPSKHYHTERISLLGELLNTLKHELMNPLFGLNLGIQMLEAPADDSETQEFLKEMLLSVSRSQNIIDNFSQLYDDINSSEKIDLEVLLSEIITLTKSETKQITKNIDIKKPCLITSNKTSLSQIIFNLIINAAQSIKSRYQNPNEGIISIKAEQSCHNLVIHLQDNGLGISNELQEKIFTPFFTTKQDGTGLGLTICKNLTEKINGVIEILPHTQGAYFKITLKDCI